MILHHLKWAELLFMKMTFWKCQKYFAPCTACSQHNIYYSYQKGTSPCDHFNVSLVLDISNIWGLLSINGIPVDSTGSPSIHFTKSVNYGCLVKELP